VAEQSDEDERTGNFLNLSTPDRGAGVRKVGRGALADGQEMWHWGEERSLLP
jgi:hypothetical protein